MPYAQEDMEAYAPTCGVAYDAKVKGIRDGLLIMPICTTRAAQACVRNTDTGVRMPISLLRTQHITHVYYVLLAITESNILITAIMNTIHGLLTCTRHTAEHVTCKRFSHRHQVSTCNMQEGRLTCGSGVKVSA